MVHTVQQGEHLSTIAARYGFRSYETIWNDPANASLKAQRQNPNVLYPGDQVVIPPKLQRADDCTTGQTHQFRVPIPSLRLIVVLRDVNGKLLPNCECELDIDGKTKKLTSGPDGKIDERIPIPAKGGKLVAKGRTYRLSIGELDPIDTPSGWRARLANLGYYLGRGEEVDDAELQSAVEEFQCDYGLAVDGDCGPQTQAKLKEVYGS